MIRHFEFRVYDREVSLSVLTPPWLYEYYSQKSRTVLSHEELARFVTPDSVKPIADVLRRLFRDDEDFANAVLAFVFQLPYVNTTRTYAYTLYPVETLIESGVCDEHALLAASIMKAGGLRACLLYYPVTRHLSVGVELEHWPRKARGPVSSYFHDGRQCFIAEATPDSEREWRVGEIPRMLMYEEPAVIPLERLEKLPGSVSARLGASPPLTCLDVEIPQVLPQFERSIGRVVLLDELYEPIQASIGYAIYDGVSWRSGTIQTDESGQAELELQFALPGRYHIQVLFDSPELVGSRAEVEVVVIPAFALWMVGLAYLLAGVGAVLAIAKSRRI